MAECARHMSGIVGVALWLSGAHAEAATASARVLPSGEGIELEFSAETGAQKRSSPTTVERSATSAPVSTG